MNLIKLSEDALNQTPLDWDGNLANITAAIKEAINSKVNVLCLPELCITGYGCEDAFFMPNTLNKSLEIIGVICRFVEEAVPIYDTFVVSVGAPIEVNGSIYNCTVLI